MPQPSMISRIVMWLRSFVCINAFRDSAIAFLVRSLEAYCFIMAIILSWQEHSSILSYYTPDCVPHQQRFPYPSAENSQYTKRKPDKEHFLQPYPAFFTFFLYTRRLLLQFCLHSVPQARKERSISRIFSKGHLSSFFL